MNEILIHIRFTKEGIIINKESINQLKVDLTNFINNEDEYNFDIVNDDTLNKYSDYAIGIKCLCNDIKDEDSFTYKLIVNSKKFKDKDINKVDMCIYAIEYYIDHAFHLATKLMNSKDCKYFASFYSSSFRGGVYFKYSLPLSLIDKCVIKKDKAAFICDVDLSKLDNEEIIKYVMPSYYREIGWHDREFIRTNLDKMNYLSKNWFKNSKFGYLD